MTSTNAKNRRTVVGGMSQTHTFLEADNPIVTDDSFPLADRARDITVDLEITVDDPGIIGTLFEMGDSTTGLTITIDGNDIYLYAGESGDDGVIATGDNVPNVAGAVVHVTAAVRPGTGQAWIWVNHKISGRATSVNGQLLNGWASSANGAVADITGTVHPDVPGPQAVILTDGTVNGRVRVYNGQIPRNLSS